MYEDLKERLTFGGRILVMEGQGDYVAGHISLRLPDNKNRFLMKPAGMGLDEMTQDNIITVDIDGQKVEGTSPRHNEVWIHSEVLRARPDVNCVIHTHAAHAVAFSSLGKPLLPVSNEGAIFYDGVPVFDETTDLITTAERGAAVARCIGSHSALILRNHGVVACAASVDEAVWVALKLERACRVQLLAEAAGGPKLLVHDADVQAKGKKANRGDLHSNVFSYLMRRWTQQRACPHCGEAGVARTFKVET